MVELKASSHLYSPYLYPSGSLIYEAANYGRTSGRVEIVFGRQAKEKGAYCVPDQRCRVSNVSDRSGQIFEVHIF